MILWITQCNISSCLPIYLDYILMREGRKEMFYLTTHSMHFILQLYGVRRMVKDHSDSERKPATATWATHFD